MIAKERLYRWLLSGTFVEEKGCSHPLDVIAVGIGCSERTVIRCVQQLECEGRVRVKRPKIRGQANTYWVDCWNPSKRCGVLAVLAGGRQEVARRRTLKHEREVARLARRAACVTPMRTAKPSGSANAPANPFLSAAVSKSCGRARRDFGVRRTSMEHRHLRLEVDCPECARKDQIIRKYAEDHSKLVEEVSAAHNVARAAGKEVTLLKSRLTREANESAKADQIEAVADHWRKHRPKSHPAFGKAGSKSYGIIEKALVLMAEDEAGPVAACCEAIDGLHMAPWQRYDKRYARRIDDKAVLRNSVEHALGDESRIERCRGIVRWAQADGADRAFEVWQVQQAVEQAWMRVWYEEYRHRQDPPEPPYDTFVVDGIVTRSDG